MKLWIIGGLMFFGVAMQASDASPFAGSKGAASASDSAARSVVRPGEFLYHGKFINKAQYAKYLTSNKISDEALRNSRTSSPEMRQLIDAEIARRQEELEAFVTRDYQEYVARTARDAEEGFRFIDRMRQVANEHDKRAEEFASEQEKEDRESDFFYKKEKFLHDTRESRPEGAELDEKLKELALEAISYAKGLAAMPETERLAERQRARDEYKAWKDDY